MAAAQWPFGLVIEGEEETPHDKIQGNQDNTKWTVDIDQNDPVRQGRPLPKPFRFCFFLKQAPLAQTGVAVYMNVDPNTDQWALVGYTEGVNMRSCIREIKIPPQTMKIRLGIAVESLAELQSKHVENDLTGGGGRGRSRGKGGSGRGAGQQNQYQQQPFQQNQFGQQQGGFGMQQQPMMGGQQQPVQKQNAICCFWLKGTCRNTAESCKFWHQRIPGAVCSFTFQNRQGKTCRDHPPGGNW
eukprot:Clim_evm79s128 gene=Clim_evmTU79s128